MLTSVGDLEGRDMFYAVWGVINVFLFVGVGGEKTSGQNVLKRHFLRPKLASRWMMFKPLGQKTRSPIE